ncbi:MAG TPA: trypsin-like serine protease [Bdellovibrio sp.]|uniref:S1 family peptidase n=1 Tax=Bdellovibrio sp. TaxID=28201 RepID=UPI002EF1D930
MKTSLFAGTYVVALSLSLSLVGCSGGSSSDASVEVQNCEIAGQSYGIINGQTLSIGNPLSESTVMVIHISGDDAELCTGTLIDNDKVLTAAHCTSRYSWDKTLIAFTNNLDCAAKAKTRTIRTVTDKIINDSYVYDENTPSNAQYDLAILKFSGSVPSQYKVRALPSKSYDPTKAEELIYSGYGKTDEDDKDSSGTLRFTTAAPKRLSHSFYMKRSGQSYSFEKVLVTEQSQNGVCNGDSGGPLYAKDKNGGLTLIGVTSMVADNNAAWNQSPRLCHGISLFVSVQAQLDWIEKTMQQLN